MDGTKKGVIALKTFLEKDSVREKIGMSEMQAFWKSLTDSEKTKFCGYAESVVNAV